ncbi:Uncharacterised protein [uncultured Ruminococcus sp.]|nr:Uncharacterised protein [uncultured Ruminococcus sp.]
MLSERHGAGIEPAVNDLRHTLHLLAAHRAGDGHCIHIRAVQLNIIRTVGRHLLELRDAADRMAMPARALPDIERRTPIAVTADGPILHILKPIAKTALANALRHPMNRVVVADQVILDRCHFNIPRFTGVVDQRGIAAPAERIAVLKLGGGEEKPPLIQILQHLLIGILAKDPGPECFFRHLAFAVHQLYKGQAVLAADLCVILAEGGSNMHHTGTIRQCDIAVTGYIPAFFLGLNKTEQRLIFLVFQVLAHKGCQNLRFLS